MIVMLRAFALLLGLSLITSSTGWADQQIVTLAAGARSSLLLESPFEMVLIEKPDIVDVHSQSDRSVIIEGLALGASDVVFIDARSVAVANVRVLVCKTVAVRSAYQAKAGCD